ncbi:MULTISPECIES: hypothetical protein [unclassified Pseudomonas]|nr:MULTISPECIES: hypothetical protein [unclassified Pseudomonas]MDB6445661.1 hypothetical protein [Pseudomonas sp. 21TX0197]
MFRRITLLLAPSSTLMLGGCLFFPHDRGHGDGPGRHGGPGFDPHR